MHVKQEEFVKVKDDQIQKLEEDLINLNAKNSIGMFDFEATMLL